MRLPERYKQTVYVSNETYFGSGKYDVPYELKGIVTPKGDAMVYGGGVAIQQNNTLLKFEAKLKGVELITQNSFIWIKKVPNIASELADFTHRVVSRDASTNMWFVSIECKSAQGNFPIL